MQILCEDCEQRFWWFDFFAMVEKMCLSEAVFALLLLQFALPLECQVLGAFRRGRFGIKDSGWYAYC